MAGFLRSLFSRRPPSAAVAEPAFRPVPPRQAAQPPATDLPPAEPERQASPEAEPGALRALEAAAGRGDLAETLRVGAEIRAAAPLELAAYVLPARALRDAGRAAEAEALLDAGADLPPDALTTITRAELALARRDFAGTLTRAEALIEEFPDLAIGPILAAVALRELGRGAEAERTIGAARERWPDDLAVLITWAETAAHRGDWRYAALRAAELRAAFPDHHAGYIIGSDALRRDGRAAEAGAAAEAGVAALPGDKGMMTLWVQQALDAGDWEAAAGRAATLRARFPGDAIGSVLGVQALRRLGALEDAKGLVADAMARCGDGPSLYVAWAEVAMDARDWPEAEEAASRMRELHPGDWIGWFYGARAMIEQGRDGAAEALIETGRARFPAEPAIEIVWTDLALRRGDWAAAAARAEHARAALPEHADFVARGLAALREAGRLDEAAALAGEGVRRFPHDEVVARLASEIAGASRAEGPPGPARDVSESLAQGRLDEALAGWRILAEGGAPPADVLDAALRITLADPWHEDAAQLFEALGREAPVGELRGDLGWRAAVEQAPRAAASPEQFHVWREASAAFLQDADGLHPATRERWLGLVW